MDPLISAVILGWLAGVATTALTWFGLNLLEFSKLVNAFQAKASAATEPHEPEGVESYAPATTSPRVHSNQKSPLGRRATESSSAAVIVE